MKVDLNQTTCTVTREDGDAPVRVFRPGYPADPADPNSSLFHAMKLELNSDRYGDWIKKRLSTDGHMMGDDATQYLRTRDWAVMIYDGNWAIRSAVEDYRRDGVVTLAVDRSNGAQL